MPAPHAPIRILIADDHPFVREGLERILRAEPYLEVIGTSGSFAAILQEPDLAACEVLVLDLGGMGTGPLVMTTQITHAAPHIRIVVFSSSVDMAPELIQIGVLGYVAKEDPTPHLVAAIRAAKAGQPYHSPIIQRYLERVAAQRHQNRLTPKELLAVKLLAQSFQTPKIAAEMGIDARCVQNYITSMYRKIGCDERADLVAWYRRVYGDANSDNDPKPM
jgi:DNA-binding NarL/FixJ family response regulator